MLILVANRRDILRIVLGIGFGCGLSLALVASTAWSQIVLDGDFDHGSLDTANSSVNGTMVTLAGRDNYNPGDWKWLYFSASNVNGVQHSVER